MTRDGEHFIARLITVDGVLTSEQFTVAAEAAEKFGNGRLAMTSRLTVEVQGLTYDTIEPFDQYIAKAGLYTGGTGSRVRPIVACKGTVCVHGLIDTQGLARELHEKFYHGLVRCKAAPQVQNRNRRLPQQLHQALPQRLRHHGAAGARL